MHASADWLPQGYKNWDALLTEAVRKGMKKGKAPADVAQWSYGSWHVVDIEHPLAGFLPLIGRIAGTGAQPLSGDTTTVKQVGRDFGPSQRFTMDWSNIDGSTENIVLGESGNPLSPYFRDQWNDYYGGTTFALPFTPAAVAAADPAYAAIAAMKRQGSGISDQGSGRVPQVLASGDLGKLLAGAAFRPGRHSARCRRRRRAAVAARQLLRPRLRFSSGLLVRLPEQLAARNPLSALGAQRKLRRRRAALYFLSAADLDAGRGAGSGPAVDAGSDGLTFLILAATGLATRALARQAFC